MPETHNLSRQPRSPAVGKRDWGSEVLSSPWLWGAALTVGFYQGLALLPQYEAFCDRYFRNHWTLKAEIACAFLAVAILIKKLVSLSRDRQALLSISLDGGTRTDQVTGAPERAQQLAAAVVNSHPKLVGTRWVRRILDVCDHLQQSRSVEGLENHLRYRADLAVEGLSGSFSLVRTITWAIPILGFLGTVIGITMSLSSLKFDPNQLADSFEQALVGLGIAFDTTALALTLSLGLVFATYLVERSEGEILTAVEELGMTRLLPLFPAATATVSPLADAEQQAAAHLLERTESLVNWQTDLWLSALEGMRNRWVDLTDKQHVRLAQSLDEGMRASLANHAEQLAQSRDEFLEGFRTVASELSAVVAALRNSASISQAQFSASVDTTWRKLESHLDSIQGDQQRFLTDSAKLLNESFAGWHADLRQSSEALQGQLAELRSHADILRSIASQTGELETLQATLTHNLQTVRALDAFEQTIQSLNAAIHLLTARSRGLSVAA
jgi:biopolymer transport protein ExbB/TolQ